MNKQHLFRNIRRTAGAAALLLWAGALVACSDDDTETGAPYFRLENMVVLSDHVTESSELGFSLEALSINADAKDPTAEQIRYDIRSNCDWTVECNSEDADKWLQIHPISGQGDGKVRFTVLNNDATASRSTTVVFRYANGRQTQTTLAVNQSGNEPYISFQVDGADTLRAVGGRFAQTFQVKVASNVDPFYTMPRVDWATFTETGNGTFRLEMKDYPTEPTEFTRTAAIEFKGSGAYAAITNRLDLIQDITPRLEIRAEDLEEGTLPSFPTTKPDPIEMTVKCNWDWTILIDEKDDWYTISPSAGEAGKEYTVKIKAQDNTGTPRSASITFLSEEVMGIQASQTIEFAQIGNGSGAAMEGLEEPVKWFFNGAAGTDYTVPTQQFVEQNNLQPQSGTGSLSYFHTYQEQTGIDDPDCKRFVGGTGQPYVTGAWPGDYWLFSTPVKNLKEGTKVHFSGVSRISGTGQKYWRLEYKEGGTTWKAALNTQTTTFNGQTITYTHALPTSTPNMLIEATVSYKRPIADGAVEFRFICAANCTGGNAALENPNGGTMRWASSAETGYNDSPIIELVQ